MTEKRTRDGSKQAAAENEIRRWLAAGEFKPGDRLPSIAEMARRMGLKTQPARKAVETLVEAGALKTVNGVGVFVRHPGEAKGKIMLLTAPAPPTIREESLPSFQYGWALHEALTRTVAARGYASETRFVGDFGGKPAAIAAAVEKENFLGVIWMTEPAPRLEFDLREKLGGSRLVCPWMSGFSPSAIPRPLVRFETGLIPLLERAYELGHRHFAFLYGDNAGVQWSHMRRYQIFIDFCRRHDLFAPPAAIVPCGGTEMDGYRAARSVLSAVPDVTCFFAATDLRAKGAAQACLDMELKIPDDVSLIGYDNIAESEKLGLTTAWAPVDRVAAKTADLLLALTRRGVAIPDLAVDTVPIFRASLGPARRRG